MIDNYPIIKIPDFLEKPNLYLDSFELVDKPLEPKPPILKSKFPWLVTIYILLGMPIISSSLGIPGFILAIILLFIIIHKNSSNEENLYKERLKHYETEYNYYQKKVTEYEEHLEKIKQREIEIEAFNENPLFKILKILLTRREYLKTSKPPCDNLLDTKRGVSENSFFLYLSSNFKDMILINKSLGEYIPDFVYFNPEFNLFIDIEIDEPYDAISREPIHYIGVNDSRDYFFLTNKWCVVRFSEKQIIEQPSACCDEIKRTVNKVFMNSYKMEVPCEQLKQDKRWSKTEAIKMSIDNYRDSYLAKKL